MKAAEIDIMKECTYKYSLNKDDKWAQFPELHVKIVIPEKRNLFIQYNIQNCQKD